MSHVQVSSIKSHRKSSAMPIEMLTSISNPQRLKHQSNDGYSSSEEEAEQHHSPQQEMDTDHHSVYSEHNEPEQHHVSRSSSHRSSQPHARVQQQSSVAPVSVKISRPLPPPVQVEEHFYDPSNNHAASVQSSDRSRHRRHRKEKKSKSHRRHKSSHRHDSSDEESAQSAVESVQASVPVIYVDRDREAHERQIKHAVNDFAAFRNENARDDEDLEKQELLYRIQQLERDGYPPSKQMDIDTSIDEVRYELYRLTRDLNKDKSLKWYSQSLITGSRMLEVANAKFDPLGLKLTGFSRNVTLNIDDFTPSLAAIHATYSGRSTTTNPIVQLCMTLIGTLLFHHVSVVAQEEAQREKPLSQTGKVISQLAGGNPSSGVNIKKSGIAKANPFSMLSGIFGGGGSKPTAADTKPIQRQTTMKGPPSEDSDDNEM